jgi:hypothetical protein
MRESGSGLLHEKRQILGFVFRRNENTHEDS